MLKISEEPILIEDSIVFQDGDGVFIYGQNQKKVSWVKSWDDLFFQRLKERGFFSPLVKTITSPENRIFSNLMLLLGRGCSLNCRYCYADAGMTTELMSKEIADRAVSLYLATDPANPKVALFGGGEPTLNFNAIKHIIGKYGRRVRWILTTSGILSSHFLEWLIDQGVMITFSVDGPPEIQNFLRPLKGGSLSSSIVEKSMRIWLNKSGKPLSVRATLTESTADQIDDILSYFCALDVENIHLEPLYNLGRATKSVEENSLKQLSVEKWIRVVTKSLKWAREKKKHIKIGELSYLLNPGTSSYCGPMCGKTIVINHNGQLTACSEVVDEKNEDWDLFCIGDCQTKFRIDEQKFNRLSSRISDNMIPCQNCFAKYLCRGGCAHKGWVATNDLFLPDPNHCKFIKAMIPLLMKEMAMRNR